MNDIEKKYIDILSKIQTGKQPIVFVNGCTHGHESVGSLIVDEIGKLATKKGTLIASVANEKAFKKNVSFIESDLNRVFPGKKDGTYEERLAYYIDKVVRASDIVIDIHSTETTEVGGNSALIVTKLDKQTLNCIKVIKPPRVLIMKHTDNNALISNAQVGLGFEYGRDKDELTFRAILRDIKKILSSLDMTENGSTPQDSWGGSKTDFYEVTGVVEKKDGYELGKEVKNFQCLKKGGIIASMNGKTILADHDFYPILFGKNRYKTIFGFTGDKIEDPEEYVKN